jgi:hypothetical protein
MTGGTLGYRLRYGGAGALPPPSWGVSSLNWAAHRERPFFAGSARIELPPCSIVPSSHSRPNRSMTVVTFLLSICAALMLAVGAYKWTQQGAVIALPYVIWGTVAFALILWNRRPKGDS